MFGLLRVLNALSSWIFSFSINRKGQRDAALRWKFTRMSELPSWGSFERKNACEALALAEGLSFSSSATAMRLVRRGRFSKTTHVVTSTADGTAQIRSTYVPTALGQFVDVFVFLAGGIALFCWSPWHVMFLAASLRFMPLRMDFCGWRFSKDAARIATALTPTTTAVAPLPYRIAAGDRIALDTAEELIGDEMDEEPARARDHDEDARHLRLR